MASSRIEKIKHTVANVDGEESTYEHLKQKSAGGDLAVSSKSSKAGGGLMKNAWVAGLVLSAITILGVYLVLIAWAPRWLVNKKKCGSNDIKKRSHRRASIDYGKTFLWALGVFAILLIFFMLLSGIVAAIAGSVVGRSSGSKKNVYAAVAY